MSRSVKKVLHTCILGLCIALLLTNTLILAPEVGAASDTNKTETILTLTEDTTPADNDVLTQRAITMDEAKKEAQAAVSEQLAIIASVENDEEEVVIETQTDSVEESTELETSSSTDSAESSSTSTDSEDSSNTVQVSYSYGYLMDIDDPDPNYVGYSISLSDYDRDLAERIVMGEAGSIGFTGMALVAQCLRDTYVAGGYTNIADVIEENGYYGSMSITPSSTCKEVISYIFDQGGSAVQHSIRVFYASNYCTSSWHEEQHYVCSYGYVRFFDL
jgi:hypothetical protein